MEPTDLTTISQYPPVPLLLNKLQKWVLFGKEFEFYRDKGRLNVKDEHDCQLAIRPEKGTCASEDIKILKSDKTEAVFTIEEWGLEVCLADPAAVLLTFLKEAIRLEILLP